MILADLNWISLNYPHFGGPTTGPYHGPPLLLVLLNFSIFLYLVWRFVWPMVERYASTRRERFLREYEHAQSTYSDALIKFREVSERRHNIFTESQKIHDAIIVQGEKEAVQLLRNAEEYVRMRMQETERQIQVKRARRMKELHDEIMKQVIEEAKVAARNLVTEEDRHRLYDMAADHLHEGVGRRRA